MSNLTNLKKTLFAKLHNIRLVLKPITSISGRSNAFKLKMFLWAFTSSAMSTFVSVSVFFTCTHRETCGRTLMCDPCLRGSIWYIVAQLYFSVDFLVHNAASVELAAGERRKGMCNISVRLTADAPPHERVLRCTEAEVWCKIVNTAGFQRGRFRARYCWDLAIEWDGEKSNPHSDVCWVKQPRRHAI